VISVVVPVLNGLPWLDDQLAALSRQECVQSWEVVVADNGSTDGSIEFIRENYPQVRVIENGKNLRFAKANNVGIQASQGEYVLILNPDTIIHEGTLDKIVSLADRHPEAGAFGCRVLNSDGSYQGCIRPLPTIRGEWIAALYLSALAHLSDWFQPNLYVRWKGNTERAVGWLAGCFILLRGDLLKKLGGFDEQFFYYHEDMDLCRRVWQASTSILYTPEVSITHLGGQSTSKRFPPVGFALDGQVTRYLYYYKHHGKRGVRSIRRIALVSLALRRIGYGLAQLVRPTEIRKAHLELLRVLFEWNLRVDPVRLVEHGEEPDLGLTSAVRILER